MWQRITERVQNFLQSQEIEIRKFIELSHQILGILLVSVQFEIDLSPKYGQRHIHCDQFKVLEIKWPRLDDELTSLFEKLVCRKVLHMESP